MMSNLAVLPIIIPLVSGILLAFFHTKTPFVRHAAKLLSVISTGVAAYVFYYVLQNGTVTLETGGWEAPYGIVLVADLLAVTLVLTTNIIGLACIFYAPHSLTEQKEKFYFYTFFFLLITGVSGAFLTGDLFNLFVFFEVLLMASYALITLGGEKVQLRESIKYVLVNLFSSIVFVTTVAFLYSVLGTVNMAQMAERVQEVEQQGILTTIGILLFFVFATKAALFPLYYWLPKPYTVPNPVVSAMFAALLTKVGVYSIIRMFTLVFVHKMEVTHELFIWIAGFTLVFGAIGALSTNNIKLVIAYNIIPAVGFMVMGVGIYNQTALSGSVYYMISDMIIKAALFLLAGAVAHVVGTPDLRKMKGLIHQLPLLGWLLFISAFVLAGVPPFSGFIGKLMIMQGGFADGEIAIVIIGLLSSLLILYSIMKIFVRGFWGEKDESITIDKKTVTALTWPVAFLVFFTVLLGIGAEMFYPVVDDISNQLMNPEIYIDSVFKE